MRLIEIIIVIFASTSLSFTCLESVSLCKKLTTQMRELENKVNQKKMIYRTFVQTCNGEGFSSLNEWQVSCRKLFNLSYIGWSKAEDFMIDNANNAEGELYYGMWIDSQGENSGEIYARCKSK